MTYKELADKETVKKTISALKENGINAMFAESGEDVKKKILDMIPQNSEVMTMTSVTLDTLGLTQEFNESGKYDAVKNKLSGESLTKGEKNKLGAAPEYAVGSVHAVTEDGKVMIASNSGSQLPAYAYGSPNVIWIVGTHKIVKDMNAGMKRINDYVLPLESERANKAYGVPGSFVSKLLTFNREPNAERLNLIFVNEVLGY